MPRVELHWRVHWYEDRFAADAPESAERPAGGAPLQMLPADGLATLTLIHARDGLSGLRTPPDIAAWSGMRCEGEDLDALIDSIARDSPQRRCNAAAELILDHESGLGPGILRISPEE